MAAIHHTVVTGQSLANGAASAVSTDPQSNTNLVRVDSDGSLDPLTSDGSQKPERSLAERAWESDVFSINTHASGSSTYDQLKKGTATYEAALDRVGAGYAAAVGRSDTFDVTAVHILHGETDQGNGITQATYEAAIAEWVSDYNTDVKAVTGQSADVIGVTSQLGSSRVDSVALAQLAAHRDGVAVLACPRYPLPYDGGLHLTAAGYHYLGQYHGKVHRALLNAETWEPVHPLWIKRVGLVITVKFHVPTPPLVFDTTLFPAVTAYGFSVTSDGNARTINSVELISADTVKITLAAATFGTVRLLYGRDLSLHGGNLRDSDPETSDYDDTPLPNWCVMFNDPVPFGSPPSDPTPPAPATKASGVSAAVL